MDPSDLQFAQRLADKADSITRPYVGAAPDFSTKADGSAVTVVDRRVEEVLGEVVAGERPRDGFVGEEVGQVRTGDPRWIVDGIDGTAAFVAGRREWATLIGLEAEGGLRLGIATAPGLDRRWWAVRGRGAWSTSQAGRDAAVRLAVSREALMVRSRVEAWIPPYRLTPARAQATARLARVCRSGGDLPWATPRPPDQRPSWGSGHPGGAMLVAGGLLDGFVMFGSEPWDHAATAIIVEEAGGRYSDLDGGTSLDGGGGVFSNGLIHEAILAALAS